MDNKTRNLRGSQSRDTFKYMHKQCCSPKFYASDLDFMLVEPPGLVACLDFKLPGQEVTFAEVLAYNVLLKTSPVYIVESPSPEAGPFKIYQYLGGDWHSRPPSVELVFVCACEGWGAFSRWEGQLRQEYRRQSKV